MPGGDSLRLAAIALLALLACCHPVRVVRVTTVRVVKTPCIGHKPPAPPTWSCTELAMPADECASIERAAWAGYGREVEQWLRLYALPMCAEVHRRERP